MKFLIKTFPDWRYWPSLLFLLVWTQPALLFAQVDDAQIWFSTSFEQGVGKRSSVEVEYEARFGEQASMLDAHYFSGSYAFSLKNGLGASMDIRSKKGTDETTLRYGLRLNAKKRVRNVRYKLSSAVLYESFVRPEDTPAEWTLRPDLEIKWYTGPVRWTTEIEPLWILDGSFTKKRVRWKSGFEFMVTKSLAFETFYLAQWRYKKNDTPYTHIGGIGLKFER